MTVNVCSSPPDLNLQRLPERVLVAEILLGDGLGQHHAVRVRERRRRVAVEEGEGEDVEEGRPGEVDPLGELHVAPANAVGESVEADGVLDLGEVGVEPVGEGQWRGDVDEVHALLVLLQPHPVDPVGALVEPVVGQLVPDVEREEERRRDAEPEPDHVDGRGASLAAERAEGDDEVVLQHGGADYS